jgi:hypothetical protein
MEGKTSQNLVSNLKLPTSGKLRKQPVWKEVMNYMNSRFDNKTISNEVGSGKKIFVLLKNVYSLNVWFEVCWYAVFYRTLAKWPILVFLNLN